MSDDFIMIGGGQVPDIADLLTDDRAETRAAGRAIATGWPAGLQAWVEAEVKRGTDPNTLLQALFGLQIQIAGGIAGSLLKPQGASIAAENYRRMTEALFLSSATRSHAGQQALAALRKAAKR